MFDLPVVSEENRRNYRAFRRFLISNGFLMLQNSVYSKLALNGSVVNQVIEKLKKNKPSDGLVQVFRLTEKQFQKMEYIVGNGNQRVLDNLERLVII